MKYTKNELNDLSNKELVSIVLGLQCDITKMGLSEAECSAIHRLHFASQYLLQLNTKKYLGSGVLIGGFYDLNGKQIIEPFMINNGFSNNTINSLLDDIQKTFDYKIELKPTLKRL